MNNNNILIVIIIILIIILIFMLCSKKKEYWHTPELNREQRKCCIKNKIPCLKDKKNCNWLEDLAISPDQCVPDVRWFETCFE